jgi:hypothetical protein
LRSAAARLVPSPVRAERRARDWARGGSDRNPRAISGPAVYPTNAPATAPTGPRISAPETAPMTALPARSCACAGTHINDPAIVAKTTSFFMPLPRYLSAQTIWKMRQ